MSPRALIVGSINMDLLIRCQRVPRPGETLSGQEFHTVPGGKGANQAVACARLGASTAFVGRVGEDAFGRTLVAGLEAEGIDTSAILRDAEASSGVALILLEEGGENRIVIVGGANAHLDDSDIARACSLLTQCDVVLMQLETPLLVVKHVAQAARERGVRVVLDAGAATSAAAEAGLPGVVDVISPNETEAEILSGMEIHSLDDAYTAGLSLYEKGAPEVVIKLGSRGAIWVGEGVQRHLPAFPITPVDTTAAGDAFTACLAVSLASGKSMEEAIVRSNAAGALACLKLGAQPSMPTMAEVEAFLKK